MKTELGKIESADVKLIRGIFLGIDFTFSLDGGSSVISSGGKYSVNISDLCKWDSTQEKKQAYYEAFKKIGEILETAKVDSVKELEGIPVKVMVESNVFIDFEILTEVL